MGRDPDMRGEEATKRLSLDIRVGDHDFIVRFAAYRAALARVQETRLRRSWNTKRMAESMLEDQCDDVRKNLADMFEALGPLPAADDEVAMAKYAKRAAEWTGSGSRK